MPGDLQKRWNFKQVDPQLVANHAAQLHVSPLLARLLILRGCGEGQAARRYLSSTLRDDLPSPFSMADMEPAVERIVAALKNQEQLYWFSSRFIFSAAM